MARTGGDACRMSLPDWSSWRAGCAPGEFTIGIEEELMLLDPGDWRLAFRSDDVIAELPDELQGRMTLETHAAVMEVHTGVHRRVADAVAELAELRRAVSDALAGHGLRAAVAGMHPSAVWHETVVAAHPRYRQIDESMRVLARREPTLAMHVHVGVASAEDAVRLLNRLRAHLPLVLALAANSPFWQGRATGFASTRTTLFDAFPRSGVPRAFRDYADWTATVDALVRAGAIADPSLLWWDVRLQPRHGTVEVRVMDAQTTAGEAAVIAALVQSLAAHVLASEEPETPREVIEENRFLAARDGMDACLIDAAGRRESAQAALERAVRACEIDAARLGCRRELAAALHLGRRPGAARQLAHGRDLRAAAASLALAYARPAEAAAELRAAA
jgi:glutamate---cysteine ligase / carboxylate-amine ligase